MHHKKELSLRKFMDRFPTEESCEEYLFQLKWPDGFICPKCGCREFYHVRGRKLYQCKHCRHQSSVTANTVMHRTHKPLTAWFQAIYFVASDKRGRAAGNQSVIVCVSKDTKDRPQFLKMTVVPNVQRSTVEQFVDTTIEKGTTVQTDSYRSYIKPLRKGYNHESADYDPNSEHLKWLHTIIGNAKAFLKGTYHGTSTKYLQSYLSEFCYRFNRRSFHGQIFDRLVLAVSSCN